MDINSIKTECESLNKELKIALSKMERSNRVFVIRQAISDLQKLCPHNNGHYDFSTAEQCPYCGKHFGG